MNCITCKHCDFPKPIAKRNTFATCNNSECHKHYCCGDNSLYRWSRGKTVRCMCNDETIKDCRNWEAKNGK